MALPLSGRELVKIFTIDGWEMVRQRGSHMILVKAGHMATLSVPDHKEIAKGTLRSLTVPAVSLLMSSRFLLASKFPQINSEMPLPVQRLPRLSHTSHSRCCLITSSASVMSSSLSAAVMLQRIRGAFCGTAGKTMGVT